jgi:hypothetical protein
MAGRPWCRYHSSPFRAELVQSSVDKELEYDLASYVIEICQYAETTTMSYRVHGQVKLCF